MQGFASRTKAARVSNLTKEGTMAVWQQEWTATLSEMWLADRKVGDIVAAMKGYDETLTYKAVLAKAAHMELPRRRAINPNRPLWTEEAKDRLRVLHADPRQFSGTVLATMMNAEFGLSLTRNAIIGQIDRMGLPHRIRVAAPKTPMAPRERRPGRIAREAAPVVHEIIDQQIPFEQRKTLLELAPHHCRFPVGDPQDPDFFFCGATKLGDSSYCAAHHKRSRSYTRSARPFSLQKSRFML
jgi:GcrA cell cycle regulator